MLRSVPPNRHVYQKNNINHFQRNSDTTIDLYHIIQKQRKRHLSLGNKAAEVEAGGQFELKVNVAAGQMNDLPFMWVGGGYNEQIQPLCIQ